MFAITCWTSENRPTSRSVMTWSRIGLAPGRRPGRPPGGHLLLDPPVGWLEPLAERDRRLPPQHLAEPAVVGAAAAHALGAVDVPQGDAVLARHLDDDPRELVYRHHLLAAKVERLPVARGHQPVDPLDAVVDIAERPRLLPVAPDLDLPARLDRGHLPAQCRRHLLAAAVVGPVGAVDVVKADDRRLEPELAAVVQAQALGDELLPAVGVLRVGRVGVSSFSGATSAAACRCSG